MSCQESEVFVSALYDGEEVPRQAAEHISECAECRSKLRAYSDMSAELRLAASMEETPAFLPAALLNKTPRSPSRRWAHLWQSVPVPRYVIWILFCTLAVLIAAIPLMRAGAKPMWFLFGIGLNEHKIPLSWDLARDGYDQQQIQMPGGPLNGIAIRVAVTHVAEDHVFLRVKAQAVPDYRELRGQQLSMQDAKEITFIPGQALDIPVGGVGTIHLMGRIEDHQPKIAWGQPLELNPDQFIVRSPALVRGNELIFDWEGATSIASVDHECVWLTTGTNEKFLFALHPFPGAIEGQATWGELKFEMDGARYRLISPAPFSGGDQPRKAWVRRDENPDLPKFALGGAALPQ